VSVIRHLSAGMTDAQQHRARKEAAMSKLFRPEGERMFRREERILSETRRMLQPRTRREAVLEHIAGAALILIFAGLLFALWVLR